MRAIWFVLATMSGIAFAGDLIRIDDSAVKESFCNWHPSDVLCEDDPVDPPVDPNEPIDPCIENPETDGCPCPDDSGSAYPDCPVDPPVCEIPTSVEDNYGTEYEGKNLLDNDLNPSGGEWWPQRREGPVHGDVVLARDGTFEYTPNAGYQGADSFKYAAGNHCGRGETVPVTLTVGDSPPVDPPVDPNEPPVDPNEPPVDPNEPQVGCTLIDAGEKYPECEVTYKPQLPQPGHYSVPGACDDLPVADHTVTVQDRESLTDAYSRLRDNSSLQGGTIIVPWDVDLVQCDILWIGDDRLMGPWKLSGTIGPEGQRPRLYCRADTRDGTIPVEDVAGAALKLNGPMTFLIENLHIDGYKKTISTIDKSNVTVRNSYFHHAVGNGIGSSNTYDGDGEMHLEFCGNEVSHMGQGNWMHNFYIHRAVGGGGGEYDGNESWTTSLLVDNLLHSANASSNYKAIANENTILNNRFYGTLDTDPSYSKMWSSMLIDIPACSKNRIEGNLLYAVKPEANSYGDLIVGIRNRKTKMRGCDLPLAWTDDKPPIAIPGPVHTPEYWAGLNEENIFRTDIKNNTFYAAGEFGWKYYATTIMGTYPNFEERSGGPACFLEIPENWYERARVYASGNDYYDFTEGNYYKDTPPTHDQSCETQPQPPGPGPQQTGMIIVGEGETYH